MTDSMTTTPTWQAKAPEWIAFALMTCALLAVLMLHVLLALIAGLAAFTLHRGMVQQLRRRLSPTIAHRLALLLVLLILAATVAFGMEGLTFLSAKSRSGGLPRLLQVLADALDQIRLTLPAWLADRVPDSALALHDAAEEWLRGHAAEVQGWGHQTLRGLAHVLAGLVIGFVASAASANVKRPNTPFSRAWRDRLDQLAIAFGAIVSAQLRIAIVNTVLTGLYLMLVLPVCGYRVPFTHTLVAVTFFAGLLPVVGNLISNVFIVLASVVVSPWLGAVSLGFLIGVHKLEYFLNAHIVGSRIKVRTYELLAAMLLMEAAFGLAGLIAAPIYYAWLTRELKERNVI